jgi:hypothetical protein
VRADYGPRRFLLCPRVSELLRIVVNVGQLCRWLGLNIVMRSIPTIKSNERLARPSTDEKDEIHEKKNGDQIRKLLQTNDVYGGVVR